MMKLRIVALASLLASCGGGDMPVSAPGGIDQPPELTRSGVAIVKFRAAGNEWVAMTERLRRLEDLTTPDRQLLFSPDGSQSAQAIEAPSGWSIIDFALHPSGETTVVLASNSELRLQRRAATGELIGESSLVDEQAEADPFIGDLRMIRDSRSLVPPGTRDAVRVAAAADDVVLAYRTGRNAVIAQRLAHLGAGRFGRQWRRIVEPGVPIDMVRLIGGSFDPFTSLDNQWQLTLDVDEQGRSAIAVSLGHTELPAAHRQYFGEAIDPALISGIMLTLLDAGGLRLSAIPIDTRVISEVHAVRWMGDSVLVGGRMYTTHRADGGGWDGYLARYQFGNAGAEMQVLDFDRGDAILDVAPLPDGRIAVAGSTGYLQNPDGGSISEDVQPLFAVLTAPGAQAQRVPLSGGPRVNEIRTIATWRRHSLIGGLTNGPGTHSADVDPTLLTCDGFLREPPAF